VINRRDEARRTAQTCQHPGGRHPDQNLTGRPILRTHPEAARDRRARGTTGQSGGSGGGVGAGRRGARASARSAVGGRSALAGAGKPPGPELPVCGER
jgi:hypothetical protein